MSVLTHIDRRGMTCIVTERESAIGARRAISDPIGVAAIMMAAWRKKVDSSLMLSMRIAEE